MSQIIINIGGVPNDGTGDTLRGAFANTNNNFTELYSLNGIVFDKANTACSSVASAYNNSNLAFDKANTVGPISEVANAAYVQANLGYFVANAAYVLANLAYNVANSSLGSSPVLAFNRANDAYDLASAAFDVANTTNTRSINAFDTANSAISSSISASQQAAVAYNASNVSYSASNTAYDLANAAFDKANSAVASSSIPAYNTANGAFVAANNASNVAILAFDQANTAYVAANDASNVAVLSFTTGNAAFYHANAAFNVANTANTRPQPYDVGGFVTGVTQASERIFQFNVVRNFTIAANCEGSTGNTSNTATANAIFTIRKNTSNVGTMIFAIGANSANFNTSGSIVYMNVGDYLSVTAPAIPDSTLSNFSFTFKGTLV